MKKRRGYFSDVRKRAARLMLTIEKFAHIIIDSQAKQGESIFYVARDEQGFEFKGEDRKAFFFMEEISNSLCKSSK